MDGYTIDWIDRDGGFRLIRWDKGIFSVLFTTAGDLDPGETWRVEFDEDLIIFYSDDEDKFEVSDDMYRSGYFGFWAYSNNEMMALDNLVIGEPPPPPEDRLVRGDSNADGQRNITAGVVDRTRPLCPHPQKAVYRGSGSFDAAESFVCR